MWCSAGNFCDLVEGSWKDDVSGTPMYQLVQKLKRLKPILKQLNKDGYSDIQVRETKAYQELLQAQQACQQDPTNVEYSHTEQTAAAHYQKVHEDYISFIKSRLNWLTFADESSKLFHQSLKLRKIQGRIQGIRNTIGDWVDSPQQINDAFLDFYTSLLGS